MKRLSAVEAEKAKATSAPNSGLRSDLCSDTFSDLERCQTLSNQSGIASAIGTVKTRKYLGAAKSLRENAHSAAPVQRTTILNSGLDFVFPALARSAIAPSSPGNSSGYSVKLR